MRIRWDCYRSKNRRRFEMLIMIAGPYRSGAKTSEQLQTNLDRMNAAAIEVFRLGHTPVIGVNMALPMIRVAGDASFDELMMPVSLALAARCDAVLRLSGASTGADQELEII